MKLHAARRSLLCTVLRVSFSDSNLHIVGVRRKLSKAWPILSGYVCGWWLCERGCFKNSVLPGERRRVCRRPSGLAVHKHKSSQQWLTLVLISRQYQELCLVYIHPTCVFSSWNSEWHCYATPLCCPSNLTGCLWVFERKTAPTGVCVTAVIHILKFKCKNVLGNSWFQG